MTLVPMSATRDDELLRLRRENLNSRELRLIASFCSAPDASAYWQSADIPFVAPSTGTGPFTTYNQHQRIMILNYCLFNWVLTEERERFFPRRSLDAGYSRYDSPISTPSHVFPKLARHAQLYDLIPAAALGNGQVATRCERPRTAVAAAVANRAKRGSTGSEGSTGDLTLRIPNVMAVYAAPRSTPAYITAVEEAYYLSNPLKAPGGRRVRLGQASDAAAPAPGSGRPAKPSSSNFIPPTALAPGILDTLVRQLLSADEMSFLHTIPSGVELPGDFCDGDWVCVCNTHNFRKQDRCVRPDCNLPRPPAGAAPSPWHAPPIPGTAGPPTTPAAQHSMLGDPGDWYCDHCGLCNWTRRAFCLRCCPLHPDNAAPEEAITKGIVHTDDPILAALGLRDKRNRALKKTKVVTTHCPCFGPHHGTRCANAGLGVPAPLWRQYVESQEDMLFSMRSGL
ncbi:uncharacterized protein LOC62_03G004020 [Vanrija pseudolonga]|uniref:RanBP2-type domain-containing protein n=1 Tax=Vanrija pseudolonga TaxID=143232 RepID=A0AAF0YBB9_9TREE|nr:hypothetical protein LOC62_03G004020 [Vanrija pseudolonga]